MSAPRTTIDQLPAATAVVGTELLVAQQATKTVKLGVSSLTDIPAAALNAHLAVAVDAHDASAISAVPNVDPMLGTDVQTQLSQAANRINSNAGLITGNTTAISDHVAAATDAHDASAVSVVSIPEATGINVQAVLENLATRVAALEAAP